MAKNEVDKARVGGKEMKNYEAPEFLPLSYSIEAAKKYSDFSAEI